MDVKYILRKMHFLRTIYYKIQFMQQLSKLPNDVVSANIDVLKSMKNKYRGKRCFIIGNGPSLVTKDLDMLKNEITFASNRIYTLYDKTEWRPTFYCVQDEIVIEKSLPCIEEVIKQSEYGFISMNNYSLAEASVSNLNNALWILRKYIPPKNNLYNFSDDATKAVYEGLTITYSCMQLAAHMGFSEIYLLGIDHNYPIEVDMNGNVVKRDENLNSHFEEAKVSANETNLPQVVEMTRAYISAKKHSENNGYKIFNATRGGKLEVFQRVDFDSLF